MTAVERKSDFKITTDTPYLALTGGALMFLLFFICASINDWVNNRKAGDLRRHRAHYGVIVMFKINATWQFYSYIAKHL